MSRDEITAVVVVLVLLATSGAAREDRRPPAIGPGWRAPLERMIVTSGFRTSRRPDHLGLDLAARSGDPVFAVRRGTVLHAGPAGSYGNLVTIQHDGGIETRYAHLSAIDVVVGEEVVAGQRVGSVGSTGLSEGPHLHFETRRDGVAVDPSQVMNN